jgi:SAM-dependent methyltransferase
MLLTLSSRDELSRSRDRLRTRGMDFTSRRRLWAWHLPYMLRFAKRFPTPDFVKSWDVDHALDLITRFVPDRDAPVLDMGCFNSEILYVLHAGGYRRLYGCDLDRRCRWMAFWNNIRYDVADLTRTSYPDHEFAAVTCLSVVEHGVPVEALVAEARRLLRPGGLFILTTDYDGTGHAPPVPSDFRAFGAPWTLFGRTGLHELIGRFVAAGFQLVDPSLCEDVHAETPVSWNGYNYTFALVALRAPTNPPPAARTAP